jgi:TatD DNase family protein
MPTPYLDFHTHHAQFATSDVQAIQNIVLNRGERYDAALSACSVGLHPWYLEEEDFIKQQLIDLEEIIKNKNVVCLGEAGLDKLVKTPIKIQERIFEQQLELACRIQKPMIIHCVKAFSELVALKKRINPTVPMIVHGFNQKPTILTQLLDNGFYISLGTALLHENSNAQKALQIVPKTYFFLETDDQTSVSIQQIYEKATQLLDISVEETIRENFKRLIHNFV